MKKSSIFVAILVLTTNLCAAHAVGHQEESNPLLRFLAGSRILREAALYTLLENRCSRYMKESELDSCQEAVDQKVTLLDFDILFTDKNKPVLLDKTNPESFVFVAFRKDFLNLLSDQKTEKYLKALNTELNGFISGRKKVIPNLWEISLKFYGAEFEAARSLAVLFQDVSHVKLHLAYLEISGAQGNSAYFDSNRHLLDQTIDNMNLVLDNNRDNFQELFYPREVQAKLHRTIYHFYVPTYLAHALKKKGVPARFAFIAPLMMTLTYEFVTAAQDDRYLLEDPKRLQLNNPTDQWKLGDIIGGYMGASFGSARMNRTFSFAETQKAFDASTMNGVQFLLK
ncbi:MAG: hypothetical protein V4598_01980 [Bdellovibrionota bacterium]